MVFISIYIYYIVVIDIHRDSILVPLWRRLSSSFFLRSISARDGRGEPSRDLRIFALERLLFIGLLRRNQTDPCLEISGGGITRCRGVRGEPASKIAF